MKVGIPCVYFAEGKAAVCKWLPFLECAEMLRDTEMCFWESIC